MIKPEGLEKIEAKLGKGSTFGTDLDRVAKTMFPVSYKGLYIADEGIPKLADNTFVLLWRNSHWFVAYRKQGQLRELDSYELDNLGPKYVNYNYPDKYRQSMTETNCGQRALLHVSKIFRR